MTKRRGQRAPTRLAQNHAHKQAPGAASRGSPVPAPRQSTARPSWPDLNGLWCRAIAEELVRAGCGQAVLCPGSRNSPLLFALATAFGDGAWSWLDERGGAFAAVAMARASGRPAVICVTSGTAVAEVLPAVMEAAGLTTPLIVLAADRPWEVHGRGAAQTTAQRGIFAAHSRELALGEPVASETAFIALRSLVSRAAQARGPVIIHVPLRDPLICGADVDCRAWSTVARKGRGAQRAFTTLGMDAGLSPLANPAWWGGHLDGLDFLKPGLRGLILAGASAGGFSPWPGELAKATGFPLLADAASNQRLGNAITTADALLSGPLGRKSPDLIIQIGPAPLHRGSFEWLARQRCPVLAIDNGTNCDTQGVAWAAISRPHPDVWRALGRLLGPGDAPWAARWQTAEQQARTRLRAAMRTEPWGEVLAAHLACTHPAFTLQFHAAGMSLRHGNLHVPANTTAQIFANRGVNGIDGCVAAFAGALRIHGGRGLLLIGDLALLHDVGSLRAVADLADGAAVVVLNNDGGGIFDFLPVSEAEGYRRWVRTPHGRDLRAAAAHGGLEYRLVADRPTLTAALDAAQQGGHLLIECDVRGCDTVTRHRALVSLLAR